MVKGLAFEKWIDKNKTNYEKDYNKELAKKFVREKGLWIGAILAIPVSFRLQIAPLLNLNQSIFDKFAIVIFLLYLGFIIFIAYYGNLRALKPFEFSSFLIYDINDKIENFEQDDIKEITTMLEVLDHFFTVTFSSYDVDLVFDREIELFDDILALPERIHYDIVKSEHPSGGNLVHIASKFYSKSASDLANELTKHKRKFQGTLTLEKKIKVVGFIKQQFRKIYIKMIFLTVLLAFVSIYLSKNDIFDNNTLLLAGVAIWAAFLAYFGVKK